MHCCVRRTKSSFLNPASSDCMRQGRAVNNKGSIQVASGPRSSGTPQCQIRLDKRSLPALPVAEGKSGRLVRHDAALRRTQGCSRASLA